MKINVFLATVPEKRTTDDNEERSKTVNDEEKVEEELRSEAEDERRFVQVVKKLDTNVQSLLFCILRYSQGLNKERTNVARTVARYLYNGRFATINCIPTYRTKIIS